MEGVTVRLLGPVDVMLDDEPRAVTGLRRRAILALLGLNRDIVVSTDHLIDVVWNGSAPATVSNTLQRNVSHLRTVLADRASILARPPGYLLSGVGTDAQAAQRLIDVATRTADPRCRASRLDGALALWRGPALTDVSMLPGFEGEARRLDGLRLRALQALFDARLDAGEHEQVLPELRRLAAGQPFDERLHRQLTMALYRTGRQAEALAVIRGIRERLRTELGLDPSVELHELELAVLRHAAVLTGAGSVALRQSDPNPRERLPQPDPAFSGRDGELTALDGVMAESVRNGAPAVVTVAGGAGVGKTSLVVQWAHLVADSSPDGRLYLNLRCFDATGAPLVSADIVRELLAALEVPVSRIPVGPHVQLALLRAQLVGKRILLVLDNARDADQVCPLLFGLSGCFILVTSRHQLIPLVERYGARPLTVDLLDEAEARELLLRRIGVDRVAAAPAAVGEIIARCARLPLALSIAAAWAVARPRIALGELVGQLAAAVTPLDVLTGDPDREVRRVFSWSYETLSSAAARLLRLLGLHPGPDIGLCAAASLSGLSVGAVVGLLDELRRANLVAEVAPARYAMHDLLRAYARELAGRLDGGDAACVRLLDYYLHTAQAASNRLHGVWSDLLLAIPAPGVTVETLPDAAAANAWLDREHHALINAVSLAAQGGQVAHVWGLAWTLTLILDTRGYWHEYLATQRAAVQVVDRAGEPVGQAHAHHGLGRALSCLGRDVEAMDQLRTAFQRYEAVDDRAGMADVQLGLGFLCDRRGDHDGALAAARLALALFRAADHRSGEAASLSNIGWSLTELGDYEQALTFCSAGLSIHEKLGDLRGSATSWHSLGAVRDRLDQRDAALDAYRTSLALARRANDRCLQADTLQRIGDLRVAAGDSVGARDVWWEAATLFESVGHPEADRLRSKLRRG
jgi:DNA-binding SARP family transcriptional activator/tetratricopeptide (TPR) repeat protein